MSIENLAALLDSYKEAGAFLTEGETAVTASRLDAQPTIELLKLAGSLGWPARVFDSADSEWQMDTIEEAFQPFRVEISKPASPPEVLRILTNTGFASWLKREDPRLQWQVALLKREILAIGASFAPWNEESPADMQVPHARSPRLFVKEFSGSRQVPASLNRWILRQSDDFEPEGPVETVWAEAASRMLMLSIPDEYSAEQGLLRFKGPPRLDLVSPSPDTRVVNELGSDGFLILQRAVSWVFEVERESEMRHILLATEIARCGGEGELATLFLKENLSAALEAARTAYQLQLAGMSSDALKTLSELRKSVTDETSKVTESTRQIITAVAGALAIGVGLIAARLTAAASPFLITLVMAMAGLYVAITIFSGVMFTLIQRKVRKSWQPRLYRFLSSTDYDALVGQPATSAERTLWVASLLGTVAIVLMAIAIQKLPMPVENGGDTNSPIQAEGSNARRQ